MGRFKYKHKARTLTEALGITQEEYIDYQKRVLKMFAEKDMILSKAIEEIAKEDAEVDEKVLMGIVLGRFLGTMETLHKLGMAMTGGHFMKGIRQVIDFV